MKNKESRTKFWMRKWQEVRWSYFRNLKVGDTFDTSVNNHNQMVDRLGDIIFWYRTDKGKEGIYFITKVVSEPKKDDAYQNGYSISLQVIKTIVNNPIKLEKSDFNNLIKDINAKGQGGANTNLLQKYEPEKLYELLKGNEAIEVKDIIKDIDSKELEDIIEIKDKNINDGKMFNPFLDMNLVRNEVRHLSFLTNLLNPNGTHHQGTLFLELFIKGILNYHSQNDNKYLTSFCDSENIYVQTEKTTPKGRIDIWLENDDFIIAIEGKTESKDSKNQLIKYDEYLQTLDKPYLLIYLTIFGEEPQNNYPDNLQLMDFYEDIITFIKLSLENESIPDKIYETLNEYYNSMIVYLNNFSHTWSYELDLIKEITKDEDSYKKFENIKNNYFYNTKKYKYTVVEDIANVFEKAKAKLERDFLSELSLALDEELEKKSFYFSGEKSNILVEENPDSIYVDINKDVELILQRRQARSLDVSKNEYVKTVQLTGSVLTYINNDSNQEIIFHIINDSFGLNIIIDKVTGENTVNRSSFEIYDESILHSSNINQLLNKKYMKDTIGKYHIKILNILKEIEI